MKKKKNRSNTRGLLVRITSLTIAGLMVLSVFGVLIYSNFQ